MLPKGTFPHGGNRRCHRQKLLAKQRATLQLVENKANEAPITTDDCATIEDCTEATQATLDLQKLPV